MFSGSRSAAFYSDLRQLAAVVSLAVVLWVLPACTDRSPPPEPHASLTATADAPAALPPRRLVSLYPSITEIIIQLGEADRLVARTGFDRDPRLAHLPSLGPTLTPSLEAVVALRPDLVIVASSVNLGGRSIEKLNDLGVPLEVAEIQTIQDVLDWTRRMGTLLAVPERADSAADALETELARIRARYHDCTLTTAMFVLWPDPPRTAGPGTYADEVIRAAGAQNAFHDVPVQWPDASLEEIVRRDPDVLILPAPPRGPPFTAASLATRVGWRDLTAVREGRVLEVEGDLFNRPGARVAEAARTLGRLIDSEIEGRCSA
jgi:iron complex transport system substrate-binding protein